MVKIDIVSAEEARRRTEEIINDTVNAELAFVKDLIEEAISKGEYRAHCYEPISGDTRKVLKEKGYTVEHRFYMNEFDTTIKWGGT